MFAIVLMTRSTSPLVMTSSTVGPSSPIFATTRGEMVSRHQAMLSEQEQANYLLQRWRILAGSSPILRTCLTALA